MIRHQPIPKLSPADRAHILVMKQEARRRRIERLIEAEMHEHNVYEDCMQVEACYAPSVLHHHGTQWECRELARVNELIRIRWTERTLAAAADGRPKPALHICFTLPLSAYEQKRCGTYCDATDIGGRT